MTEPADVVPEAAREVTPEPMDDSSRPKVRHGLRVSPHILIFMATLLASIPPVRMTVVSFTHWWWNDSYRQVDFVMDEARPNDGTPYIAGHLDGETEQQNLPGAMRGDEMVVAAQPDVTFAAGGRVRIWYAPDAPNYVIFGQEVNLLPVAALPERPGAGRMMLGLMWLGLTWIVGMRVMAWVAQRWSRDSGTLKMDRRSRKRW